MLASIIVLGVRKLRCGGKVCITGNCSSLAGMYESTHLTCASNKEVLYGGASALPGRKTVRLQQHQTTSKGRAVQSSRKQKKPEARAEIG